MRKAAWWLALVMVAASGRAAVVYDFTSVTNQIDGFMAATPDMDGASLIVVRNGTVIYENYFGSYTPATQTAIASASKWLSALAIERLVASGEMSWNDTVGKYLPEAPADKQAITLGQLFSHTSGLDWHDDPCLGDPFHYTLATCADQILATPSLYAPGAVFAYTGNGMQVGGRMAEVATGLPWATIFVDEVTLPLDMPATYFVGGVTNPRIAGGGVSTMLDYVHAVTMLVQHGQWNATTYLPAADVAEMQRDQTFGAPMVHSPDPNARGYGYGEWRNSVDAAGNAVQLSSTGAFGTSPWINNETGVAAVFFTRSQDLGKPSIEALWANVNAVVTDPIFSDGFEPLAAPRGGQ